MKKFLIGAALAGAMFFGGGVYNIADAGHCKCQTVIMPDGTKAGACVIPSSGGGSDELISTGKGCVCNAVCKI